MLNPGKLKGIEAEFFASLRYIGNVLIAKFNKNADKRYI